MHPTVRHILIACLLIVSSAMALATPSHPAGAAKPDGGGFGHPTATPTIAPATATATWTALPTGTPPAGTPTQTSTAAATPTQGTGCAQPTIDSAFYAGLVTSLQQYEHRVEAYWGLPCLPMRLHAVTYRDPVSGAIGWHNTFDGGRSADAYVDVQGQNSDTIALMASHELAEMLADPTPYRYLQGPYSGPCVGCPGGSYTGTVSYPTEIVDPIIGAGAVIIGAWWLSDFATPSYFTVGGPPYDAIGGVQHPGSPCWGTLDFTLPGGSQASEYNGNC